MSNIKCVIAAGGLGTRLQGFRQNDKTKILLEVNGVPMINRQIYQNFKRKRSKKDQLSGLPRKAEVYLIHH